jgi:heat shock protein HslJ
VRFDGATSRVSGFGGCNKFAAAFTSAGDTLLIGPIASTRMSCAGVDELERSYFNTLSSIKTYSVSEPVLTLNAVAGPVARFRER